MYTVNCKTVYIIIDGSLLGVGVEGRDQGEVNDDSSSVFWRLEFL